MRGLLRRLLGWIWDGAADEEPASVPDARVPVDAGAKAVLPSDAGESRDSAFFCREALVGRDQKIVGYEFGYPQHLHPRIVEKRARIRRHYDDMLLRHLAGLELESFLGDRLALVEISPVSLDHPSLMALLRRKIVLLLSFPETTGMPDAQTLSQVTAAADHLRAGGARLGLKWQAGWREAADFPLLPYLDFIQVAWPEGVSTDPAAFFSGFRRAHTRAIETKSEARPKMPLRLIASGLRTPDEFGQCYRLGVDFFRGEFIDSRDRKKRSKSTVNRLRILQLLSKLRQGAGVGALEEELKQDPVLSYRVLTYANSPLLGLTRKITHLRQAVTIIGRNDLYRWLASLLFKVSDPGYYEWALAEQALARAALMERLGRDVPDVQPDALFLTGLFSLIDRLMGRPMKELATQVQLAEDIQTALVRREGVLARFLALAEACERMDPETIARRAEALRLSSRTVSLAVFDALAWAYAMTRLNTK
ncbi:MAG: HDOD domain-containing protein [Candidatus Accumulibacter sp.]|jgi:EAL and modified HD-GYP domain-containing signal transduction protein|nr:HDOD domain-containing protein [Accumulibacter sp.]